MLCAVGEGCGTICQAMSAYTDRLAKRPVRQRAEVRNCIANMLGPLFLLG